MSITRRLLFALFAIGFVAVAAAPHYHRTRPAVRCAIPEHDYHYGKFSQPQRSFSNEPLRIEVPRIASGKLPSTLNRAPRDSREDETETVKAFQFVNDPRLQIDHCSISELSVLLHESGRWSVNLRADQNPLNEQKPLNVTTSEPRRLFTDHMKRNEFHLVARCYANHGPAQRNALLGKPIVIQLDIKPFWVQRQEPHQLFEAGFHPHIQTYFDSIDRVEIEFAYRQE